VELNDAEFLVMACDGVWDVMTDQMAVDLVADCADPNLAATMLRDCAFLSGSSDNISAIVLHFRPIKLSHKKMKPCVP